MSDEAKPAARWVCVIDGCTEPALVTGHDGLTDNEMVRMCVCHGRDSWRLYKVPELPPDPRFRRLFS